MDQLNSVMSHLGELRTRIIYALVAVVAGIIVGWVFVPDLYAYIMSAVPQEGTKIVQIGVSEVFMVQFHMGVWLGIILASPVVIYQAIAFVLPALKPNERRLLLGLLPATFGLFILGVLFSYNFIVPTAIGFFFRTARASGAEILVRPSDWVDTIIQFSVPMGVVFELPVLVWVLASFGIISAGLMRRMRKFEILVALVVGAFLSPGPSPIDKITMTLPMLVLYEISIWLAALVERRRKARRVVE